MTAFFSFASERPWWAHIESQFWGAKLALASWTRVRHSQVLLVYIQSANPRQNAPQSFCANTPGFSAFSRASNACIVTPIKTYEKHATDPNGLNFQAFQAIILWLPICASSLGLQESASPSHQMAKNLIDFVPFCSEWNITTRNEGSMDIAKRQRIRICPNMAESCWV